MIPGCALNKSLSKNTRAAMYQWLPRPHKIAGNIDVVISGNVLPGRDLLALADENIKPTVNEHSS